MAVNIERHHVVPQNLLRLHDRINGSLPDPVLSEAWLEWSDECYRWRVPVMVDRSTLELLVASSVEVLDREKHRLLHQSDFVRWGRRGGRETFRRYGSQWMSLLALKRWGRITSDDLSRARVLR